MRWVSPQAGGGGVGPVITTNTGGIPEASGGHCLIHEAGNVAALRACLDRVGTMTLSQRRHLATEARTFAMRFDRRNILTKLLEAAVRSMRAA
jgi:hypothetical protein